MKCLKLDINCQLNRLFNQQNKCINKEVINLLVLFMKINLQNIIKIIRLNYQDKAKLNLERRKLLAQLEYANNKPLYVIVNLLNQKLIYIKG